MNSSKTVLITGAGTGIGRALAIEAAQKGFDLILVGRTSSTLDETLSQCSTTQARCIVADVTSPEGRTVICQEVSGRLDILINNAGVLSVGHLADMTDENLQRMAETNLVAPMALSRDLLPALRSAKGRIVNIGSVFGDIAYPFFAGYSATKFGLRGFSDAIRRELSGTGIGVTYVAPRATQTAAESAFGALVEPLDMTLDTAETVAAQAWDAILKGKRESFPKGKERFFVKVQRLFPSLVDKSVGAQARDPRTLAALKTSHHS
ncbi:SDR family NAD(P)-dependent oxidoreductase [Pseudophaeobacter sp.]|uniref:SDR family NAD(P)-dependent oxidoreductase n=1 Tax=Pseudophaeobacter sp. TaxID=1971739 RepID=UPI002614E239|nr:SDR family NAD(P)-dependent oxidoreductase [Pseudophaeobacter sp.]